MLAEAPIGENALLSAREEALSARRVHAIPSPMRVRVERMELVPAKQAPRLLLPTLPVTLSAEIAGFLGFAETCRLSFINHGAQSVLTMRNAWEPAMVDRRACAALLRRLRKFVNDKDRQCRQCPLFPGLLAVGQLHVDLMDADCVSVVETRIATPFEELRKLLSRCGAFSQLRDFKVSNIDQVDLNIGFLEFRGSVLRAFPQVCVQSDTRSPHGNTLTASRMPGVALPPVDRTAVARSVAQRVRCDSATCALPAEPASTLSREEALFLQEHTLAFKKEGEDIFHVVHSAFVWQIERVHVLYGKLFQELGCSVAA